jgi:hypothetical protein
VRSAVPTVGQNIVRQPGKARVPKRHRVASRLVLCAIALKLGDFGSGLDATCQKEILATQQITSLFDHLVGNCLPGKYMTRGGGSGPMQEVRGLQDARYHCTTASRR